MLYLLCIKYFSFQDDNKLELLKLIVLDKLIKCKTKILQPTTCSWLQALLSTSFRGLGRRDMYPSSYYVLITFSMKSWVINNIFLTICNMIEKSCRKNNLFTQIINTSKINTKCCQPCDDVLELNYNTLYVEGSCTLLVQLHQFISHQNKP